MRFFLIPLFIFLFFDGFSQLTGHSAPVNSVRFSPDGNLLASGSRDKTIKLWRVSDGTLLNTLKGHTDYIQYVNFSPDGNLLVSEGSIGSIKFWRVSDGTLIKTIKGNDCYDKVSFSPDGNLIAYATDDKTIILWQVSDGTLIKTLQGHTGFVQSVHFSPDGNLLASTSDETIKLWRVSDGTIIKTFKGHKAPVNSVCFSPDGNLLASASGSDAKTIKLWRVSDGTLIKTLKGHAYFVYHIKFSQDGNLLVSLSSSTNHDNTIKFWRVSDGTLIKTFIINDASGVFFISPDMKLFARGSQDKTIHIGQVTDGSILKTLQGHTSDVLDGVFSPDGNLLASGSKDNSIILWDVNKGTLIRIFGVIPTTHLSGIFMTNSNNPAPYTDVFLLNEFKDTISRTVTNEKGEFRFEQINAGKTHYLVPFDKNFKFNTKAFFYYLNDKGEPVLKTIAAYPVIPNFFQSNNSPLTSESKSIFSVDFTGELKGKDMNNLPTGSKIYILSDQNEILYATTIDLKKQFNLNNVQSNDKFTFKTNFNLANAKMVLLNKKNEIIEETNLTNKGTFKYQMIPAEKVITVNDEEGNKVKIGDGQRFNIYDILFDLGKWELSEKDKTELDKIAKILNLNPNIAIELNGHTDCRGDAMANKELSGKRVMTAVNYLASRKIEPNRIYGDGYGEEQPLNNCIDGVNCTEEEYAVNRRLEIIIRKTK